MLTQLTEAFHFDTKLQNQHVRVKTCMINRDIPLAKKIKLSCKSGKYILEDVPLLEASSIPI